MRVTKLAMVMYVLVLLFFGISSYIAAALLKCIKRPQVIGFFFLFCLSDGECTDKSLHKPFYVSLALQMRISGLEHKILSIFF